MKQARVSLEQQWYLNLAFFFGRQWTQLMTTSASNVGFRLFTPPAPSWRVRLTINKIRPVIRRELAKVTSQRPNFDVMPRTTEDEDLIGARVGQQILTDQYREKKIQDKLRSTLWWTLICGTGHMKDYFDPSINDICVEPVSTYNLFIPDLKEEEIEKQPYVMHASTMPVEKAKHKYKLNQLSPNVTSTNEILDDIFLNLIGAKTNRAQECLVLEQWIKPGWNKDYPNGGLLTVVGDQLVVDTQSYPWSHGEYPFSKITHIPSGRYYGTSVIEDLIPLQREYNRSRSQIVESKNRMSKPQLMAPKGAVKGSRITTEPGLLIEYQPGLGKPEPLQMQNLPSYVAEELMRLQQDMDDISGQHEISRGGAPPQVTAATAISYLQEQDDTLLSHTIVSIEEAIAKTGRHILSYVSDYWNTGRLIRVTGDDGSFDAQVFKGSDLRKNHDVVVEAGSALPSSKAARQAFVMDLLKMGVIQGQDALKVLEIGGIEKVYSEILVDQKQAQRENLKMSRLTAQIVQMVQLAEQMGQPVPELGYEIHDWDNHGVHIMIHNSFRKGQQYEMLSPESKQFFEIHVQMHKQMQQQEQMQQLMMNGGVPPDGSGESTEQQPEGAPNG